MRTIEVGTFESLNSTETIRAPLDRHVNTTLKSGIRGKLAFTFALLLVLVVPVAAQVVGGAQRAALEARISQIESQLAAGLGDAVLLRVELRGLQRRLAEGDFRPGDVVVLGVVGDSALSDTFTVELPRELRLPGIDPIDLTGVLADELQPYLEAQLGRYVREPTVVAYSLIRVAVTGGVARPGVYLFRRDTPVLDVFVVAGGFRQLAVVNDVELRRAGKTVVDSEEFTRAMAAEWNLQQLDVRPADEIHVPESPRPMTTREWVLTIAGLVGLVVTILTVAGVF